MSELEKIAKLQYELRKIEWTRGSFNAPLGEAVIILHRHALKDSQFYARVTSPAEDAMRVFQPEEVLYLPELLKSAARKDHDIIELHTFRNLSGEDCLERVRAYAHAYCATYMETLPARFTTQEMSPQ